MLSLLNENVGRVLSGDDPYGCETELVKIQSGEKMLAFAEENRRDGQVHFVDLAGEQVLAEDGDAAADADVLILSFALGCGFGLVQGGVGSVGDEVEGGAAFHFEWRARVMREDEDGRVVGRIVAPPASPGVFLRWG